MRDIFFAMGCKQSFFCFQVRLSTVKQGNRGGSSRNESHYFRRGTQISVPLLEGCSCDNSGQLIAHFSIVFSKQRQLNETGVLLDLLFFNKARKLKNELLTV